MSKKKEKSFLFETVSGKSDGNSGKRMRECRGSCGFLGALKSLLRHSITTGATSVTIRIDLEYPYLQIADNGVGISRSEIGEIGKTTFLDLITAAEEVLIETMTMSMEKSTVMKFRNKVLLVPKNTEVLKAGEETFDWLQPSSPSPWVAPKAISCTIESPRHQRHSVGTTFTLTNIQLSIMEKIEQLDKKIVNFVKHFAIVHYQMSITLKNIKGNKLIFGAKKTKSITERVTSIFNLADMEFNSIVKSSNNITIEAYWGTKLYHSSAIQFVFINGQPCSNIRLLKTIKKEWKCDTKKKYPVYVLCITIRATANGNIDKISHDSVIKDCIRECVAKSGGFKEAGYISSDDDDLQTTMKSVYCRPQFFWDTKQHKKKKSSLQNKEDLEIFKLPSPREIEENHKRPCETSILDKHTKTPEKSITNLTVSEIHPRSSRRYFISQTSSPFFPASSSKSITLPSQKFINQSLFVGHLEEETKRLRNEVNYLRNSKATIDELKKRREEDQRKIEQLTRENHKLISSQKSPRDLSFHDDGSEPKRHRLAPSHEWKHPEPQSGSSTTIHIYNYNQLTVLNGHQGPGYSGQIDNGNNSFKSQL